MGKHCKTHNAQHSREAMATYAYAAHEEWMSALRKDFDSCASASDVPSCIAPSLPQAAVPAGHGFEGASADVDLSDFEEPVYRSLGVAVTDLVLSDSETESPVYRSLDRCSSKRSRDMDMDTWLESQPPLVRRQRAFAA